MLERRLAAAGRAALVALIGLIAVAPSVLAEPAAALDAGTRVPDHPNGDGGTAPSITGVLVDAGGEPVGGVEIVVEQEGTEIGRTVSDDEGRWSVPVPAAGTYQVTLLAETLPEGVALRDPDRATLERVRVREGFDKPVRFLLGEGAASGLSPLEKVLNLTVSGIRLGLILAVASIGLSLVFGVTGLTNFAHGDLVTFGALAAYFLSTSPAGPGLPLLVAAPLAMVAGGGFGYANERLVFRPLRRRKSGNVSLIVVTIGLGIFLRNLYLLIFGGSPRPYDEYTVQRGLDLGPISPRPKDLAVMGLCALVLVAYATVLQRTRLGMSMRAVADNGDLAEASGIDVDRTILLTWVGGAGLAALGGVVAGISDTIQFDMGFGLLLLMFSAVILGGLGTAYGPVLGGLVIGLASQLSTYWLSPKFRSGVALAVLIVVVLIRPQGILGRRERVG